MKLTLQRVRARRYTSRSVEVGMCSPLLDGWLESAEPWLAKKLGRSNGEAAVKLSCIRAKADEILRQLSRAAVSGPPQQGPSLSAQTGVRPMSQRDDPEGSVRSGSEARNRHIVDSAWQLASILGFIGFSAALIIIDLQKAFDKACREVVMGFS